jgi:hypothetical protein
MEIRKLHPTILYIVNRPALIMSRILLKYFTKQKYIDLNCKISFGFNEQYSNNNDYENDYGYISEIYNNISIYENKLSMLSSINIYKIQ